MRMLIPTLTIMLGFALACGEGDDATDDGPVITVEPQQPPAQDEKVAADNTEKAPAEPTEKVVTETITSTVSVPETQKGTIEKKGRQAIIAKGKGMGYKRVNNIKIGNETCSGGRCTASVSGTVSKTIMVEADDASGDAAE